MRTGSGVKRWLALSAASALVWAISGSGAARADVTVERTMTNAGFGGMGASTGTMVEKYGGLRRRDVTSMKMSGFLGKVTGDLGGDEITNIEKDAVWRLDHKKKTYTESKITPPPAPKEEAAPERAGKEQEEKPKVRVVRNEISVTGPDGKKTIGDFSCDHYAIVWVLETEDLETKARSESTMTSDLWTTPETAEIRALQKEEMEFTKAWLKKIGWEMSQQEAQKMGLAMVGALIGGDEESLRKGTREVAEKMAKIQGYPIGTRVTWRLKSSESATAAQGEAGSGKSSGGEGESAGMPDLSRGLGGLMSAFGKKVAKSSGESTAKDTAKGDAGAGKTVFDTYSEIRRISTASLPDSDFAPPAGYTKVD